MPDQALAELADQHGSELPGPGAAPPAEAPLPKCPPGTLRFAAHLGLALVALELIPPLHDTAASLRFRSTQARQPACKQMHAHAGRPNIWQAPVHAFLSA